MQINDWLNISEANGSSGITEATITVSPSKELNERTQAFRVSVEGKEVWVNIIQKAFVPTFEMDKSMVTITQDNIKQYIQIETNVEWEATTDADWIALSHTEGGSGQMAIWCTKAINYGEERNGKVTFKYGDYILGVLEVNQIFEVVCNISETAITLNDRLFRDFKQIRIDSNVDYTIECDEWLSVLDTVTYDVYDIKSNDKATIDNTLGYVRILINGKVEGIIEVNRLSFPNKTPNNRTIYYSADKKVDFREATNKNIECNIVSHEYENYLGTIVFSNDIYVIPEYFGVDDYYINPDISKLTLPSSVYYLDDYCFYDGFANLNEINFGGNEIYIGKQSFKTENLSKFSLPSTLKEINYCGLGGKGVLCENLGAKTLVFTENLDTLGFASLAGMGNTDEMYFYCNTPPLMVSGTSVSTGEKAGVFDYMKETVVLHAPIGSDYSSVNRYGFDGEIVYDLEGRNKADNRSFKIYKNFDNCIDQPYIYFESSVGGVEKFEYTVLIDGEEYISSYVNGKYGVIKPKIPINTTEIDKTITIIVKNGTEERTITFNQVGIGIGLCTANVSLSTSGNLKNYCNVHVTPTYNDCEYIDVGQSYDYRAYTPSNLTKLEEYYKVTLKTNEYIPYDDIGKYYVVRYFVKNNICRFTMDIKIKGKSKDNSGRYVWTYNIDYS